MSEFEYVNFFQSFKTFTELVQSQPKLSKSTTFSVKALSIPFDDLTDLICEEISKNKLESQSETIQSSDTVERLNSKLQTSWGEYEDKILEEIAIQYCRDWKKIKSRIEKILKKETEINFLKVRFSKVILKKINKKGHFQESEDKILLEAVNIYGSNWVKIAEFLPGRCPLMMKNRYYYLKRTKLFN